MGVISQRVLVSSILFGFAFASFVHAQTSAAAKSKPPRTVGTVGTAKPTEVIPLKPFTNADIIKLENAGFSDDDILAAINAAQNKSFDTSADGLIGLKSAGVAPRVIAAVLGRPSSPEPVPAAVPASTPVTPPTSEGSPTTAVKQEDKGNPVGRFFGGVGRPIGIKKGDDKSKTESTVVQTMDENSKPILGWEQETRSATIRVSMAAETGRTKLRQYYTSKGTDHQVNHDSGSITTGWKPERCQGLGRCVYSTTVQFNEEGGQTLIRVRESRVYSNELTNAKSNSYDEKRSKKIAAELAAVLANTSGTPGK